MRYGAWGDKYLYWQPDVIIDQGGYQDIDLALGLKLKLTL